MGVDINSSTDRINNVLGFDPTKNRITSDILKDVIETVRKEEVEKLRESAAVRVRELITKKREAVKLQKEFDKNMSGLVKVIDKALNQIENDLRGVETVDNSENTEQ